MLNWANQFDICCFFDDNNYHQKFGSYDCLLAAGAVDTFAPQQNILARLKHFNALNDDWLFGHFSYDLKNEVEQLYSGGMDNIGFSPVFLFRPGIVISIKGTEAAISSLTESPAAVFEEIIQLPVNGGHYSSQKVNIQNRINRDTYIRTIKRLQEHILRGDCYEINFCQEFFAEDAVIEPIETYRDLSAVSPSPFSCYYKLNDKYLLCASPERYIKKTGNKIISQPMKGTATRDLKDDAIDNQLKVSLLNSAKDKSENVMVVDLVRNDLSKICTEGSVQAEELFAVQSFPQVHQMVSTISGTLKYGLG